MAGAVRRTDDARRQRQAPRFTLTIPTAITSKSTALSVPQAQREQFPVGPYDKGQCVHKQEWPPKELADEAERFFQASLARMRERRTAPLKSKLEIDLPRRSQRG